jgi:hypothetical protein
MALSADHPARGPMLQLGAKTLVKRPMPSEVRSLECTPDDASTVAEQFFRDHDAYEPGIYPRYFFGDGRSVPRLVVGEKRIVHNPGFILCDGNKEVSTIPQFERVDYLVFDL